MHSEHIFNAQIIIRLDLQWLSPTNTQILLDLSTSHNIKYDLNLKIISVTMYLQMSVNSLVHIVVQSFSKIYYLPSREMEAIKCPLIYWNP